MTSPLPNLLRLVGSPRDGALLRFSIGAEYLKQGDFVAAVTHLREAVAHDPNYSAAWKLLGNALVAAGDPAAALAAYERGIAVADARGDRQAAREMSVFAKRLRRQPGPPPGP